MHFIQGLVAMMTIFIGLDTASAQVGQPRPCSRAGDCVTRQHCTDTIKRELHIDHKWADPTCNFDNDLPQFNIVRRKVILPEAVRLGREYINKNLWNFSALQLALMDIYHLWPNKLTSFESCTRELHEEIWLEWLDAHDVCFMIYRSYSDREKNDLVACIRKRQGIQESVNEATRTCLEYVLGVRSIGGSTQRACGY